MGGLEAGRRLLAVRPDARVVVLTATLSVAAVREARTIGAVGYLLKDDDPVQLPVALRAVAAGGTAWGEQTFSAEDAPFLAESPFPPTQGDDETA
jgi:DNA-binding NarL/FixJ family response regulator